MTEPHLQKQEGPAAAPAQPQGEAHSAAPPPQPREQGPSAASPPPAEPPSALRVVRSVGESVGVIAGLAFISGWLYWATYYSAFGLNPLTLEFPVPVVSVSQLQVIVRDWKTEDDLRWKLIALLIVCAVLSVLLAVARARRHPGAVGPLLLLAVGIPAGTLWLGLHDAELDAGCQSRLPLVAFLLDKPPDPLELFPDCLNNTLTCRLILHSGSTYHYFQIHVCEAGDVGLGSLGILPTAEVDDREVRMVRINREVGW